jgi:ribosome maturation factor RimP
MRVGLRPTLSYYYQTNSPKGDDTLAKIDEALEKIALDVCQRHGVYIYETEYKKEGSEYFLRLFIDKEGGVTIEDCENVSREISPLLDNLTFIKEAYIFEVSSPGIDRVLSRDWHFEKVMGEEIEIKLFAPLDGKKDYSGILKGYNDGIITIETDGKEIQIEKQKAASVRLAFNF